MNTLEVDIINPISINTINEAILEITQARDQEFLIINIGEHEFDSLDSLKYLKAELIKLKLDLLCFSKVAFVHPVEFPHEKTNSSEHEYFTSKLDAQKWLTQ